jgi:hypothetical protein
VKKQLIQATEEARAEREDRDAASVELKSLTQKLMEERSKHENFHRRAAELVRQVTDERVLDCFARQELESRIAEQSRLLMTANSSSSTNEVPLNIAVCKVKDRCSPARGTRRSDALEQLALPFIRPYDAVALRVGRQSQRLAELQLSVALWWGTMSGLSPSAPAHSFALVGRQHSADEFRLAGIVQSNLRPCCIVTALLIGLITRA